MTKETFTSMLDHVRAHRGLYLFTTKGGRILTYLSYVVYPILLIWLFYTGDSQAWQAVVVPAAGFIILSIVRYLINAPRPYEVFDTPALVVKKTRGKSFPSRHVFSAFIISFTAFWFYPWLGLVLGICGVLLSISRVLSGVHFRRDVIAGALSGIGLGLIGFLLL